MKVIQFINPMFLTALGLHTSLLFVPLGGEPEPALIEEDVPLAELSKEQSTTTSDPLLKSDPKAATETAAKASSESDAQVPPKRVPPRKVPPQAVVVPRSSPAPVATVTRSVGTVATAGNASRAGSASYSGLNRTPYRTAGTNNRSAAATSSASRSNETRVATNSSTFVLPDLSESNNAQTSANRGAGDLPAIAPNASASNASTPNASTPNASAPNESAGTRILSDLLASVNTEIPDSLDSSWADLTNLITYSAEGTDDESAQKKLDAWKAEISRQANTAQIENVELIAVSEPLLAYPIKSLKSWAGRSLSVCLEQAPHTAEVGLLFDSRGELVGKPELIRSTGYAALNTEVVTLLTAAENFPENRESKAYVYSAVVDYNEEACVSLESLQAK